MSYSIRQVCEYFGLTAHTLRYYEKMGLLTEISRTKGGIRVYSEDDMETLGLICCLKNTGMPLAEIARFIALTQEGEHTLQQRCEILRAHQQSVEQSISKMQKHMEKITCKIEIYTQKLSNYQSKQSSDGTGGKTE